MGGIRKNREHLLGDAAEELDRLYKLQRPVRV